VLALGGVAAGIGSELINLKEKNQSGTLDGGDMGTAGLNIISALLPGTRLLGKLTKISGVGQKFAFLEGKYFIAATYTAGLTDASLNGLMLSEDFVKSYDALQDILPPLSLKS
jgi:hypothetical protein